MPSPPASIENYSLLTADEQPKNTLTQFSARDTQSPLSDATGESSHTGGSQEPSSVHTASGKEPSMSAKAPLQPTETARAEPCDGIWGKKDQAIHKQLCDKPTFENCQEARRMEARALQQILDLRVPTTGMVAFALLGMAARRSGAAAKHVLENIDQKTQPGFYVDVSLAFVQAVNENLRISDEIDRKAFRVNRMLSVFPTTEENSGESQRIEEEISKVYERLRAGTSKALPDVSFSDSESE